MRFVQSEELPELPAVDDVLRRRLLVVPGDEAGGGELLRRRAAAEEEAVLLLLAVPELLLPVPRVVVRELLRRGLPTLLVRMHLLLPKVLLRLPQVQRRVLRSSLPSMLACDEEIPFCFYFLVVCALNIGIR
jgi:hypothetical protein